MKSSLIRLKTDIRNVSKIEVKNKGRDLLKDIIENIIDANDKLDDMSGLEVAKRQERQGLKILTPQQMLSS